MKNKSDFKYITVPLSVIKRLYTHPKTAMSDIFDIGIYNTAKYQDVDETNSIKQTLYCYYRGGLTKELHSRFDELVENEVFSPDLDYSGFRDGDLGVFNPDDEIEGIREYLEGDLEFRDMILDFHALRQVKDILGITFNIESVLENIEKIKKILPEKDALVTIKKEMMFDYYKNKKTAYEIDMFACYLGIRSILGKKEFCFTTRKMILCRMIGCKSSKDIKDATKVKELKKVYESYSIDYRMTKLLDNLVVNNFISKIAVKALRRTYLSTQFNMVELEQAIKNDLQNNSKKRIQKNKQDEKDAASRILGSLKAKNN